MHDFCVGLVGEGEGTFACSLPRSLLSAAVSFVRGAVGRVRSSVQVGGRFGMFVFILD